MSKPGQIKIRVSKQDTKVLGHLFVAASDASVTQTLGDYRIRLLGNEFLRRSNRKRKKEVGLIEISIPRECGEYAFGIIERIMCFLTVLLEKRDENLIHKVFSKDELSALSNVYLALLIANVRKHIRGTRRYSQNEIEDPRRFSRQDEANTTFRKRVLRRLSREESENKQLLAEISKLPPQPLPRAFHCLGLLRLKNPQ